MNQTGFYCALIIFLIHYSPGSPLASLAGWSLCIDPPSVHHCCPQSTHNTAKDFPQLFHRQRPPEVEVRPPLKTIFKVI